MAEPLALTVFGAAGRMGLGLVCAIEAGDGLELAAALVREGSAAVGQDAGELAGIGPIGVRCGTVAAGMPTAGVAVEFTGAAGFDAALAACVASGCGLVSGSTGLVPAQERAIEEAARTIPILRASNMSLGVELLGRLLEQAARALADADLEIFEAHHRHKADSPSGTALTLAERAARARGQEPAAVLRTDRIGDHAERVPGEIGISAIRAGEIVGEHTALLGLPGERIELTHRASDRAVFVNGALAAARFLARRPARLYGLADVLSLDP